MHPWAGESSITPWYAVISLSLEGPFVKFILPHAQNPQAVNTGLDVFTANRRDIRILESNLPPTSDLPTPVGVVAIGAMLVGSINWTNKSEGYKVAKGEDIGWFQYGGSTVIVVFPGDRIEWDADLVAASEQGFEVQVRVGERIGRAVGAEGAH